MFAENINIGSKVRFAFSPGNDKCHAAEPKYFPAPGTVGEVKNIHDGRVLLVQWPAGSTIADHCWYVGREQVEIVNAL